MGVKRKIEAEEPFNANKRRTRSMGPLPDTPPAVLKDSPKKARRRTYHENDQPKLKQKKEGDGEDELLLSPSKTWFSKLKTPPRTGTARYILHSVEITTPSNRSSKYPQADPGSPSSIPRTKGLFSENVALSTDSPHTPRKRKTRQPSSLLQSKTSTNLSTPSPKKTPRTPCSSPSRLPRKLPQHLYPCLHAQKRAVLRALQDPRGIQNNHDTEDDEELTNNVTFQQLLDLLDGTVTRGEGNSCLLLGPRGSGKTSVSGHETLHTSLLTTAIQVSGALFGKSI
jgi:origin recognition complex subunit 4